MERTDSDYDYERPRRRRFEDHDDRDDWYDQRPTYPQRSGLVTTVGVINIVWGSLITLASLFIAFIALVMMGAGNPRDREDSIIPLAISLVTLIMGSLYLTGGIGVLNRRQWARILSLVLGAFNFVMAMIALLGTIALIADRSGRRFREEDVIGIIVLVFFGVLFNIAYGLFMYLSLLRGHVVREFR